VTDEKTPSKDATKKPATGRSLFRAPAAEDTAEFYDALIRGDVSRGMWGAESRFDPDKIASNASVHRYFEEVIRPHLTGKGPVLDIGCGTGGFLAVIAGVADRVVGIDISAEFVGACRETIARRGLTSATVELASSERLPHSDGYFEAVVIVDVLHHLGDVEPTLREVRRVLKPGGDLIVFEPNKLNPMLFAMCALDRNEWGLLRLGSFRQYRRMLEDLFTIETMEHNGLLIGPDGPLFTWIADRLSSGWTGRVFGWLCPKIFIHARKPV
jgi:2-polyprenyl-3-methyl-5-hydroxy-6-metoxy-1,4-benzoquinol methylase